jgi:NMD protein affecting ribosome stability and mRNA decay
MKEAAAMKIVGKVERSYKQTYKKKTSTSDPYLPRGASRKVSVCEGCRAVYMKKRWYADGAVEVAVLRNPEAAKIVCPACLKIRDNFPGGIVTLKGDYVLPHKQDLLNLVKNEEARARGFNPLERVMSVKENGYGSIVISTTNEKLAQRLGRAIKKAFHGEVAYHWSHDNKLARVDWVRE